MSVGIHTAASGAMMQQKRLEMLTNNLANVNTAGFKQSRASFQASAPDAGSLGFSAGVLAPEIPFATVTDFTGGPVEQTGNPLDLALQGEGFFCVQTPDGVQYTRAGNFTLDAQGLLVTADGCPVLGEGGEIRLQQGQISVDASGQIVADDNPVDRLRLVRFDNPGALEKIGHARFRMQDPLDAGMPAEDAQVHQGALERSNVDAVAAMAEMIETLRGFEAYQRVIRSIDEVTSKAINEAGRLP